MVPDQDRGDGHGIGDVMFHVLSVAEPSALPSSTVVSRAGWDVADSERFIGFLTPE